MAIEGLNHRSEHHLPDDVGAAVEALNMLGLVKDRDQVTESVTAEFEALDESGVSGEKYIQLPRRVLDLQTLIEIINTTKYSGGRSFPEIQVDRLWTPQADSEEGYGENDIGNLALGCKDDTWPVHGRIAVHNTNIPPNRAGQDPLLHFTGLPYDEIHALPDSDTLLDELNSARVRYRKEHPGFTMKPLNASAVAMMALMRRVKGQGEEPLDDGTGNDNSMIDATLPRVTINGNSVIGSISTDLYGDHGLIFSHTEGYEEDNTGVGLSVGREIV